MRYVEPEFIHSVLRSMAHRRPKLVNSIGSFDDFMLHYPSFSTFFAILSSNDYLCRNSPGKMIAIN